MVKVHFQLESNALVKVPVCAPLGWESWSWNKTFDKKRVNCKKCLEIMRGGKRG